MNESVSKCDFSVIKEIKADSAALWVIVFNAGTGTFIVPFITDFYCHGGVPWGGEWSTDLCPPAAVQPHRGFPAAMLDCQPFYSMRQHCLEMLSEKRCSCFMLPRLNGAEEEAVLCAIPARWVWVVGTWEMQGETRQTAVWWKRKENDVEISGEFGFSPGLGEVILSTKSLGLCPGRWDSGTSMGCAHLCSPALQGKCQENDWVPELFVLLRPFVTRPLRW